MRQRVMIAMALALEPQVVIMDEPTTALDVVMQRQILAQLVELRQRLDFSVLFITHDLSLLVEFSDRIAIMYGGRIVEEAPAGTLYRDALHPYSEGLLHSFPALRGVRRELTGIPWFATRSARDAGRVLVPSTLPKGVRSLGDRPADARSARRGERWRQRGTFRRMLVARGPTRPLIHLQQFIR